MELKNFYAQDSQGNVQPGAGCYLYHVGTETLVEGLTDINDLPKSNPFYSDEYGSIQFKAPDGLYDLRIVAGGADHKIRIQFIDALEAMVEINSVKDVVTGAADTATNASNTATSASNTATQASITATQASITATQASEDAVEAVSTVVNRGLLKPVGELYYSATNNQIKQVADGVDDQDAANIRLVRNTVDNAMYTKTGGITRKITDKLTDMVSVKDFGAIGNSLVDDTEAIKTADQWCANNGYTLYFPQGVYRITDGIESFSEWEGVGSPNIGTFALLDDKQFLVQGQRNKIPGSTILFDGTSTKTFTTLRTDEFASVTYVIKKTGRVSYRASPGIRNMGIVLNFDYKTPGGAITLPSNDNSAIADVGLFLHNVELKNIHNVCVGGYYKKSGIVHFGIDPDNTHLSEVRTMGNIGLSIIGDTTGTNSGLNAIGCFISANDHHSRSVDPENERWGKCALYIDIPSSGGVGSRNGISFIGGAITTKTNYPVILDRCGAINFTNVVFENATQAGSGAGIGQAGGTKRFIGTTYTSDIGFINCRLNAEQIKNSGALLDTAPNANITIVGGNAGFGMEIWRGLSGIRMNTGTEQNFQMTNDPSSITTGVRLRRTSAGTLEATVNNQRVLAFNEEGVIFSKERKTTATIAAGAVTIGSPLIALSGGTTDLTTITGTDGLNRVTLMANTSSDIITLKHGTGNLRIVTDFVLSGFKTINLVYNGLFWLQEGGRPS